LEDERRFKIDLPAKGPVRIVWQIIFIFIPVLNLWAFYRIKKLRKFFLIIWIPEIVITLVIIAPIILASVEQSLNENMLYDQFFMETIILYIIETGFTILCIYLVYKWSKEWNRQFLGSSMASP
jgi:hypothetical protein